MNDDWNTRVAAVWADDAMTDEQRIAEIDALAAQRPADDAVALFERAGARDSAGQEAAAEPLYRAALEAGLDEELRPQAVIQLASTLRNLGKLDEALRLLQEEYEGAPDSLMRDRGRRLLRAGARLGGRGSARRIDRADRPGAAPAALHAVGHRVRAGTD